MGPWWGGAWSAITCENFSVVTSARFRPRPRPAGGDRFGRQKAIRCRARGDAANRSALGGNAGPLHAQPPRSTALWLGDRDFDLLAPLQASARASAWTKPGASDQDAPEKPLGEIPGAKTLRIKLASVDVAVSPIARPFLWRCVGGNLFGGKSVDVQRAALLPLNADGKRNVFERSTGERVTPVANVGDHSGRAVLQQGTRHSVMRVTVRCGRADVSSRAWRAGLCAA